MKNLKSHKKGQTNQIIKHLRFPFIDTINLINKLHLRRHSSD